MCMYVCVCVFVCTYYSLQIGYLSISLDNI